MRITLKKHEVARHLDGAVYGPVYQYKVEGLPPGNEAFITSVDGPGKDWQILRVENGVSGYPTGHYPDGEEALRDLQREVDGLALQNR